jgi:hypothetical protein
MGESRWARRVLTTITACLALLAAADLAAAQPRASTAEIKAVTGQVEVQRKGDNRWVPAVAGARLAEGDEIRAHAGASAVLDLPDTSTLFVAENSRLVMSTLEFDPQSQSRQAFFHVAVGKVRAAVAQLSLTLVKARQSNFVISTPTAVAAARGTVFEVLYDAVQNVMRVAVLAKDPRKQTGLVACSSLTNRFSSILVREGLSSYATGADGCSPPVPISSLPDANLIGTLLNPRPPGPAFFRPVTVPTVVLPGSGSPPVVFTSDPGSDTPAPPSTIGQDLGQRQLPGSSPVTP